MTTDLTIGQLARATGTRVPTIRYYEQIGLLPAPARSSGNQRRYERAHLERLGFIRHARELGFPLEEIRDLLGLSDNPALPCAEADDIARRHLAEVERRIVSLTALKSELERMIDQCRGGQIRNCRVIEVLSDHAQCVHEAH